MSKRFLQEELDEIASLIAEVLGQSDGVTLVENDDGTLTLSIGAWSSTGSLKEVVSAAYQYIHEINAQADAKKGPRYKP